MRLAFMGSPEFAVPALHALHNAGHVIVAVYAQPPRRAGRGQALTPCPVHAAAAAMGLPVITPERLRADPVAQAAFAALDLDVAVVAAYGQILPQTMLEAPRRGCLNIHASLLPRWRGAAPIQAAIMAGDAETGVTIMQMEAGLDTGPMLARSAVPIPADTTAGALLPVLAELGARLLLSVLADPPAPVSQPDGATYAPKLTRADGRLDFSRDAVVLDRQIRGLQPWPGAWTVLAGEVVKVLHARPEPGPDEGNGSPGRVLDDAGLIACGTGALRLLRLQRAGRPAMAAPDFLRGLPIPAGSHAG